MTADPFAPASIAEPVIEIKESPVAEPGLYDTPADANYVTAIIKAGGSYAAPSVSLRGADAADLRDQVKNNFEAIKELMTLVAQLGNGFAALFEGNKPAAAPAAQSRPNTAPPAGASQAPNGQTETCAHGEMVYRSGVSKAGKPYKMFACPERDRNAQCNPVWVK